jgi:hypothetical protein
MICQNISEYAEIYGIHTWIKHQMYERVPMRRYPKQRMLLADDPLYTKFGAIITQRVRCRKYVIDTSEFFLKV